jgi:hypothetical protein
VSTAPRPTTGDFRSRASLFRWRTPPQGAVAFGTFARAHADSPEHSERESSTLTNTELTNTILSADAVRDLVERMLRTSGRRVDLSTPFVDAVLPDGSRLHVVIPDITRCHWAVKTTRRHWSRR